MNEIATILAALQLGDSFFPSGGTSFSWGLETLRAEGLVRTAADVEALVAGQIDHRWAHFDRPAVTAAHAAAADLDTVCGIDCEVDAATLAREAREGARRIGTSILKVHEGMGTTGAGEYLARIRSGHAYGQMAVVQGYVAHASGLDVDTACAMSAHQLVLSQVSAALRLGLVGHVDAQRIFVAQRDRVGALMREPGPDIAELRAYTPAAEIAMMRHETGSGRMFAS